MFTSVAFFFNNDSSESDAEQPETQNVGRHSNRSNHIYTSKQENPRLVRRALRDASNVLSIPEERFIKSFRISKEVFSMLLEEVEPKMKPAYRCTHIPASTKLATFLAFIATGAQKATPAKENAIVMSLSQISKIICEMLDIFDEHLLTKWIKLEQSQDEESRAKEYFYNYAGMPGVVGCVDNMHLRIKAPTKEVKRLYKNSQGYFSLNAMIICDQNMIIKYTDASSPGSYPDAYVWEHSSVSNYFRTNYLNGKQNNWLLGDNAYNLQPYMMTPYKNTTDSYQMLFNKKHSDISKTIQNCLNALKTRFSCLIAPKGLLYTPEKAAKIFNACCILHNICIEYKNKWIPSNQVPEDDETNEEDDAINNVAAAFGEEECLDAIRIRDEIALMPTQSVNPENSQENLLDSEQDSSNSRNHKRASLQRRNLRDATNVLEFPEDQFLKTFRVNKEVFSLLLEEVAPKMKVAYRSTHIPAQLKLAVFLTVIAGSGQTATAQTSFVSKAEVSKITNELLDIFQEHLLPQWIKIEQSVEEENEAKQYFQSIAGIYGVVGCLDHIHIRIKTPPADVKHLYKNRFDFFSLNVTMICNHNMIIKFVDATQPGSYKSSDIWDESSAHLYYRKNYFDGKDNYWLLGSAAYKFQPYVMTPFVRPRERYQRVFNFKHSSTLKTIKKCINNLKRRFDCLTTPTGLLYSTEKAAKIIQTCCILHNICIRYKSDFVSSLGENDVNDEDSEVYDSSFDENDEYEPYNMETMAANTFRNDICGLFYFDCL